MKTKWQRPPCYPHMDLLALHLEIHVSYVWLFKDRQLSQKFSSPLYFSDPNHQQSHWCPCFAQVNPEATVPCLRDGEKLLTQSKAIVMYLDERDGSPLGGDQVNRKQVTEWVEMLAPWDGNIVSFIDLRRGFVICAEVLWSLLRYCDRFAQRYCDLRRGFACAHIWDQVWGHTGCRRAASRWFVWKWLGQVWFRGSVIAFAGPCLPYQSSTLLPRIQLYHNLVVPDKISVKYQTLWQRCRVWCGLLCISTFWLLLWCCVSFYCPVQSNYFIMHVLSRTYRT